MIEIVFGESACGSLKIAQTYGKGKYRGSAVSIFMRHEDGSVPSSDEMKKAQLQAQEQERIGWVLFSLLCLFSIVWQELHLSTK